MPLTPPTIAATLAANLASTGHIGVSLPLFAQAVALGVSLWAATATVNVNGTGSTGTGTATAPLLVAQPLVLTSLQTSFASTDLVGVFTPRTVLGLANGLVTALAQGILLAQVVGVGSGAGIAKVISPPAYQAFQQAFATFGMTSPGASRMALALGMAFDKTFAASSMPIPIIGPTGPAPGVGTGIGKIV